MGSLTVGRWIGLRVLADIYPDIWAETAHLFLICIPPGINLERVDSLFSRVIVGSVVNQHEQYSAKSIVMSRDSKCRQKPCIRLYYSFVLRFYIICRELFSLITLPASKVILTL